MKFFVILGLTFLAGAVFCGKSRPKPNFSKPNFDRPKPAILRSNVTASSEKGQNGWGWNSGVSYSTPPDCINPNTLPVNTSADLYLLEQLGLYYYVGGSIFSFANYAKIFLGRPLKDASELEKMCFTEMFSGSDPLQINNAFGRQFQQTCSGDDPIIHCPVTHDAGTYDGAFGVNTYNAFSTDDYTTIDSDGSTYMIYYRCVDGKYGDLQLLTTRPFPTVEAVTKFNNYLDALHLPKDQFVILKCNTPKLGWYPAPFQNYPASSGGNLFGWGGSSGGGWSGETSSNGWSVDPPVSGGWSPAPSPPTSGWNPTPSPGWSDSSSSGWGNMDLDVGDAGWSQNNGWPAQPPTNGWGSGWGGLKDKTQEHIVEEKKTETSTY